MCKITSFGAVDTVDTDRIVYHHAVVRLCERNAFLVWGKVKWFPHFFRGIQLESTVLVHTAARYYISVTEKFIKNLVALQARLE